MLWNGITQDITSWRLFLKTNPQTVHRGIFISACIKYCVYAVTEVRKFKAYLFHLKNPTCFLYQSSVEGFSLFTDNIFSLYPFWGWFCNEFHLSVHTAVPMTTHCFHHRVFCLQTCAHVFIIALSPTLSGRCLLPECVHLFCVKSLTNLSSYILLCLSIFTKSCFSALCFSSLRSLFQV